MLTFTLHTASAAQVSLGRTPSPMSVLPIFRVSTNAAFGDLRRGSLFHSIHSIDKWLDESSPSIIWSSVEVSLGIICACLPTIQPVLILFRRKVRDVTPRRRSRSGSSGLWFSESGTRASRQTEGRNQDGTYGRLDEELATLPLAYSNSDPTLERYRVRDGAKEVGDRKDVPPTTILAKR